MFGHYFPCKHIEFCLLKLNVFEFCSNKPRCGVLLLSSITALGTRSPVFPRGIDGLVAYFNFIKQLRGCILFRKELFSNMSKYCLIWIWWLIDKDDLTHLCRQWRHYRMWLWVLHLISLNRWVMMTLWTIYFTHFKYAHICTWFRPILWEVFWQLPFHLHWSSWCLPSLNKSPANFFHLWFHFTRFALGELVNLLK